MEMHVFCGYTLHVRPYNVLRNMGITSIEQLADYTKKEIMKTQNCGKVAYSQIEKMAADNGIKIKCGVCKCCCDHTKTA